MSTITLISSFIYVIFIIFLGLMTKIRCDNITEINLSFPDGFLIGTAISAYQVEGAWNLSGKAESAWDNLVHTTPEKIIDRSNGDVACDFYHKYKDDIKNLKKLGVNHFRFSLSWSRILPKGYGNEVNKEAIRYYHNILDELETYGIEPFVTIYHWDHPYVLERMGGWLNDLMIEFYANYATIVFKEFGSRVRILATINEANVYCVNSYQTATGPGIKLTDWGQYVCVHNMLKAHARAYHIYNDKFRSLTNGKIGIITHCANHYSKNKNDFISSEIAFEFECGWTANPIFSEEGDYPEIMKTKIGIKSLLEGQNVSRLPTFSKEWIEYIKGSSDYFGLNHYTSDLIETSTEFAQSKSNDADLNYSADDHWLPSQSSWLKVVPKGFGDLLRTISYKYNNPEVYVMENGVSDAEPVDDNLRILYLYFYLKEMLVAVKRDKCNVKAYTYWSFLDNFEWWNGYTNQFGLMNVDFNDPALNRTPKKSFTWLQSVLKTRKLNYF